MIYLHQKEKLMQTLIFSRDGVLRRTNSAWDPETKSHDSRKLSVQAWEKFDPAIFLKSLHDTISFEEGLTVGEMMENLAPWAELMIGVACMDFPAYLAESRLPREGDDKELDRIEIYQMTNIEAVPAFKERAKLVKNDDDLFGKYFGRKPKVTGMVKIDQRWDYRALLTEEGRKEYNGEESVSLSFLPISEYAHLPIVINREAVIGDVYSSDKRYLGTDKPVLNPENPLVIASQGERGPMPYKIKCESDAPTFFDTLIRGLLWDIGFDYSPAQRDNTAASVRQSVEDLENDMKDDKSGTSLGKWDEAAYNREKMNLFLRETSFMDDVEHETQRMGIGQKASDS